MAKDTTDTIPPIKVKVTTSVVEIDIVASKNTTQTQPPVKTTTTKGGNK